MLARNLISKRNMRGPKVANARQMAVLVFSRSLGQVILVLDVNVYLDYFGSTPWNYSIWLYWSLTRLTYELIALLLWLSCLF